MQWCSLHGGQDSGLSTNRTTWSSDVFTQENRKTVSQRHPHTTFTAATVTPGKTWKHLASIDGWMVDQVWSTQAVQSDPAFERKGVLTPAAAQVSLEDPAQGRKPVTQGRGLHGPLVRGPRGHMSLETGSSDGAGVGEGSV